MFIRTYVVAPSHTRTRLDRFLELQLPGVSRGRIRQAIKHGHVTIDGEVRESGRPLREGQTVEVRMDREPIAAMAPEDIPIRIIHEDDAILVVDKPAGMFCHPTHKVHSGTLLNAVLHHLASTGLPDVKPLLVHRLDRATSGLLVISKTPRAHNVLARAWHDRKVAKGYVALLCGRLSPDTGVIDAPIGGARDRHPGFAVDPEGRSAQTRYTLLRTCGEMALYEMEPLTGRTNQLRIHAAYAGAAIAGDDLHGQPELEAFYGRQPSIPRPGRLFLHAARLVFEHPSTGEELVLEAPLPTELEEFIRCCERRPS